MKLKFFVVFAVSMTCLINVAWARDANPACVFAKESEITQLFDRWNESLKTKNPDNVVANYAADAVLLPTLSNKPRTNHAEIRDYFVHFLEKLPVGKIDMRVVKIGCNFAIDTGLYTFTVKVGEETKTVPARYTFTYELQDGKWLISSHHSSAMPEKVVR
jgi:uncharacterized protein (TIGR02246 family)